MYPCKQCIILVCCSKLCNDVIKRSTISSSELLHQKICPDCGSELKKGSKQSFIQYNIKCDYCNHKFNMVGFNLSKRIIR